jgi:glycerol-3-phosphate dehydrogenase (NAD(P)+)
MELGRGKTMEQIASEMFMVAEGAKSAPAVMALAEEHGIDMPIARDVYRVVTGETNAKGAYRGLLRTAAGAESEPG